MSPEDCKWTTWVYGLIYPGVDLFYVGVSIDPWKRFSQHWAGDGMCSSYNVIQHWKPTGRMFDHIIFGEFDSRVDAMRLERALISTVPCLANSKSGGAMLSRYGYPPNELDEELLRDAIELLGWQEAPTTIDRSGEYVDERYDDLDLVEAP